MGTLELKPIWSPQDIWTNIFDFFSRKCLNKDSKKGMAEPFFSIFCFKISFFKNFSQKFW